MDYGLFALVMEAYSQSDSTSQFKRPIINVISAILDSTPDMHSTEVLLPKPNYLM
jgi:hypothetical protein